VLVLVLRMWVWVWERGGTRIESETYIHTYILCLGGEEGEGGRRLKKEGPCFSGRGKNGAIGAAAAAAAAAARSVCVVLFMCVCVDKDVDGCERESFCSSQIFASRRMEMSVCSRKE
jgi:hypothetical protein